MRLPRIILGSSAWIRLWQRERREVARLRRELTEVRSERDSWRDKLLLKVNVTPLFTPLPPPPKPPEPQLIGLAAKRAYLDSHRGPVNVPTAEEVAAIRS